MRRHKSKLIKGTLIKIPPTQGLLDSWAIHHHVFSIKQRPPLKKNSPTLTLSYPVYQRRKSPCWLLTSPSALERFRPLLVENIKDRLNSTTYPLDLSMYGVWREWRHEWLCPGLYSRYYPVLNAQTDGFVNCKIVCVISYKCNI